MLSCTDLPTSVPPVSSLSALSALTEMLFLGCTSDFTSETDRIFRKIWGFSLRIKWENQCGNTASHFLLLRLHHSYSRAKLQRDPTTQEQLFQKASGDSQHEGDVQEIPSRDVHDIPITGEMCRSFTPNETQGVLKCSEEMVCSKSKHRNRAGLQKMQLSNKIPQLLLELPGGSLGTEAAAKPLCQELPLLPQPSLGTRAPQTFTTTLPTAQCHLLSCILWMRSQECRGGTFWCSERPAKPGGSNRHL